jgi:hypothetical protein
MTNHGTSLSMDFKAGTGVCVVTPVVCLLPKFPNICVYNVSTPSQRERGRWLNHHTRMMDVSGKEHFRLQKDHLYQPNNHYI